MGVYEVHTWVGVVGVWSSVNQQTLKVEYSVVDSYREGAIVFIIDANDGPLQSDTAAT